MSVGEDLSGLQFAQCKRTGEFEPRELTRRQLIDEINRKGGAALMARDACKVDPRFSSNLEPRLFVRSGAVLVSFGSQRLGAIVLEAVRATVGKRMCGRKE